MIAWPASLFRRAVPIAQTTGEVAPVQSMKQFFLVSVILVPVLLGMWAAADRRPRRGLAKALLSFGLFTVVYATALYFFY